MDWLNALAGSVVAIDTAPFIYFIENNPAYIRLVAPFFASLDRGDFRAVTSTITLSEVLVNPLRQGNQALAARYFRILTTSRNLAVLPISEAIASEAAGLRAKHGFKTPDAIQIAAGLIGGASSFLTNDAGLASIPGMRSIVLDLVSSTP
jgi:predicted nucleic acid-binding protein